MSERLTAEEVRNIVARLDILKRTSSGDHDWERFVIRDYGLMLEEIYRLQRELADTPEPRIQPDTQVAIEAGGEGGAVITLTGQQILDMVLENERRKRREGASGP